jgi:tape measure domain-containing protein
MSKQVAPLDIKVGIQGLEELTRLKSAFKGLTGTVGITEDAINKAIDGIKEYVRTANNSEAVIKGQIDAFQKLKSQADITGTTYKKLDADIKRLEQELKGASEGLIRQRDALVKSASSTKNSSVEVQKYINQLKQLQTQTRASSQAFNDIEADIESLTFKMRQLRQEELADFGKNAVNATRGAISGLQSGVQQSISLFKRLGEQSKTAFGQVARTIEGITAIGVGGAIAGGGAGALGGLSGLIQGAGASLGGLKSGLGAIPFAGEKLQALVSPEAIARLNEAASNVAALQAKVAGLDQAMDAVTNAFTAFGPTASAGAIAASAGIAIIYDRLRNAAEETRVELEKSFTGIDDEVQDLIRSLTKLRDQIQSLSMSKINELLGAARQRFAAAPAGSPLSRSMASQIAGLEAIGREEAGRQAVVLEEYRQRVRGTSEAAVDLSQRLSFLKARLQEVDTSTSEGKAEFARLSSETVQLSDQLRKLGDSYRHVGTMATQAATAQENAANAAIRANYFNRAAIRAQEQALADLGQRVRTGVAGTPLALPAAGQTAAAGTGAAISGGARRLTGQVETTFDVSGRRMARTIGERAGYYNPPTAATGAAAAVGQSAEAASRASKAYRDLLVDLRNVLLASNNSISSLEQQRAAWNALRSAVDPASKQFANASKQIEGLDARLGKLQSTQQRRRRMGGMQMAQAAGAAISGGIFGGPEGFLGGAIGGIAGGVGGAFAGAAAGAQVGMLRQQLGGFADYAAQIQKMQIALENAAGSQAQFNQAMAAAESATRNLNVPQDVAIQGMTRLTAAVKGAGGQVSDAEIVFNNVTSAIKATGGSAQDVDGAITAMVQVFSKGKVSAEELSGQLGERLPGAVTKFAKANEMSLPELQKALEQGEVGLNELMKFIVQLGDEYSGVAGKIADSSQDAGARLTVAFNDMRIAIGETLQPVGAQFQEAFSDFIVNITPSLVAAAKAIGNGIKFIIDNASQIGAVVEFAAKLAGVTLALKALQAMQGPIGTLFLALQSGFTATTAQAAAAQTRIIAFGTAVKTVAASLVAPIIITVAITGAQVVIGWLNKVKEAQDRVKKAATATRGESWIQEIGGSATDYATLKNQVQAAGDTYQYLADKIKIARQEMATTPFKPRREFLAQQIAADEAQMIVAQSRYRAGIDALGRRQPSRPAVTEFPDLAGEGGKGKADKAAEKAAREAEKARQEMLRQLKAAQDLNFTEKNKLDLLKQEEPFAKAFTEFAIRRAEIQRKYNDLLNASRSAEERAQLEQARSAAYKQSSLTLQKEINQLTEKAAAPIVETVDKIKERIAYDQEYAKLLKQGVNPELAQQLLEIKKSYEESVKALEPAVEAAKAAILRAEAEGASATEIKKYREELEKIQKLPGQKKEEGEEAAKRSAEEKERDRLAQEKAERLKNLYSDIVGTLEDGIVGSLMTGIDALITGTKTLGEALKEIASGILKDIGQTLLRFAVNMGMRAAFPGAFAAKGAYFSGGQADFAQNSIKPFATGGIVTRPTFFKYAKGGEMQNGLMGEAGPEAIMPLKRGADGKLGVAAKLDGAMGRYRRSPGSAGGSVGGGVTAELAAGDTAPMAPIDVRYSVERINNVDYVTADQFQAGMAQAAQQGAIQGERRAMRTLTNSAAARGRLGI